MNIESIIGNTLESEPIEWVSKTQVWGVSEFRSHTSTRHISDVWFIWYTNKEASHMWTSVSFCFSGLFFKTPCLIFSFSFYPCKTCTPLVGRDFWEVKQNKVVLYCSLSCEKPTWFRLKKSNNKILQLLYSVRIFQKVTIFHSETFVDALHFCTATLKTQRMDLYYVRHRLTSHHLLCFIVAN